MFNLKVLLATYFLITLAACATVEADYWEKENKKSPTGYQAAMDAIREDQKTEQNAAQERYGAKRGPSGIPPSF